MYQEFERYFQNIVDFFKHALPSITVGLAIFILLIIVGKFIRRFTKKRLMSRFEDILLVNFIGRMIFLFFFILGLVIFLNQVGLGKAAGGLLAGAGVSAIIVGFAFKDIGENFLAGFFLAFSRPFSIGDTLEVESIKGIVRALNFRNTHIRTFDGKDIYVPNAMLIKNPLINYSRDGLQRFDFLVGLDYGDSFLEASKLIHTTLENQEGIEHTGALKPFLMLEEFGTSTVNVR
ncbi:MAG: mechanosensitive ion channel domain-containing protein, partial [Cyclobacteriaceae bacterium]